MRFLVAFSGLAVVSAFAACGGIDRGKVSLNSDAGGIGLQSDGGLGDGGDGGGVAGPDAGFDGGCIPGSDNGTADDYGCFGPASTMSYTVNESACAAVITLNAGLAVCNGVFSGPNDAFDGGCSLYTKCTSLATPGTFTCTGGCQFKICDGGATCP